MYIWKGCCIYKVAVLLLNLIAFWRNNNSNNSKYLGLLKNSGMIHAKFSWYWLNKTLLPNWNDLETTTQDMKLFYCSSQVIPITLCNDNKMALNMWLRQMSKFHHQASFESKILCICTFCVWVFFPTLLPWEFTLPLIMINSLLH